MRRLDEVVVAYEGQRLRILQGLRDEGETAVSVHWQLANELRDLSRVRAALDEGRPMPAALAQARLFGPRQQLVERAVPRFAGPVLRRLLLAASICDAIAKGLPRGDWPAEPWDAVQRLLLMVLQAARSPARTERQGRRPLALGPAVGSG